MKKYLNPAFYTVFILLILNHYCNFFHGVGEFENKLFIELTVKQVNTFLYYHISGAIGMLFGIILCIVNWGDYLQEKRDDKEAWAKKKKELDNSQD
jgi:hypothetical protein